MAKVQNTHRVHNKCCLSPLYQRTDPTDPSLSMLVEAKNVPPALKLITFTNISQQINTIKIGHPWWNLMKNDDTEASLARSPIRSFARDCSRYAWAGTLFVVLLFSLFLHKHWRIVAFIMIREHICFSFPSLGLACLLLIRRVVFAFVPFHFRKQRKKKLGKQNQMEFILKLMQTTNADERWWLVCNRLLDVSNIGSHAKRLSRFAY